MIKSFVTIKIPCVNTKLHVSKRLFFKLLMQIIHKIRKRRENTGSRRDHNANNRGASPRQMSRGINETAREKGNRVVQDFVGCP
jgi:hypothetical protein